MSYYQPYLNPSTLFFMYCQPLLLLLLGVTLVTFAATGNLNPTDTSEITQRSERLESTQMETQTKTSIAAPGTSATDNSPDTQTETTTGPPGPSGTGNSPDTQTKSSPGPHETENTTGIPRPTGRENDTTSYEPCLSICSPVRNAELLCSEMHPRNDALFLGCVCASNNATVPIGLCAACQNQNGDNHNGKKVS